jgi:inner membrane protein
MKTRPNLHSASRVARAWTGYLHRVDNLAHALVGAAIGRVVGNKRVPAAGWIGAIAANAPDWTEPVVGLNPLRRSPDFYALHRGLTHSLAGAAVETVAICLVLWLAFAVRRQRGGPAVPAALLCGLVAATVYSHVYMDWQGSYGLRPFLPWSNRWYYGDWVAIVDPLFWLVPLAGLAWGAERHWRDLTPFVLVAALVMWPVLSVDRVAGWMRMTCLAVLATGAIGWVRHWFGVAERHRAAALALLVLVVYTAAQAVASIPAKHGVRRAALARFGPHAQWAALTRVGSPFTWEAISASEDTVAGAHWAVPRHLDDPRVQWARRDAKSAQALAQFARFLAAEVDSSGPGVQVVLRDARYARPPATGWATVTVSVPTAPTGERPGR